MNPHFENLMRNASRLTQAGRLMDATAAIQRALGGHLPSAAVAPMPVPMPVPVQAHTTHTVPGEVLDGCVSEQPRVGAPQPQAPNASSSIPSPSPTPTHPPPGAFSTAPHHHAGLTRAYKLFVPAGAAARPLPLLVMLHGCTQSPDDFAAGTGMNGLAQAEGFCVLYPAQSQDANPQRCWNWFKRNHQSRGHGEPAFIASLTQAVMRTHGIDPARVFVAGLSAGGAMAALVGAAYPELFAAVGVHSGLAPGAAQNLPDALAAMQGTRAAKPAARLPLPVIVFHGDQDRTVHLNNAAQIIAAAQHGAGPTAGRVGTARVEHGMSAAGQRFTRTVHDVPAGASAAEHWLLHGAGHAWSGGQAAGSYTDPRGADASREMLRFFRAHPLRIQHVGTDTGAGTAQAASQTPAQHLP